MNSGLLLRMVLCCILIGGISVGVALGLRSINPKGAFWLIPGIVPIIVPWLLYKSYIKNLPIRYINSQQYPELFRDIESLCKQTNLKIPKIGILPNNIPNAFTFGRGRNDAILVLTSGLLELLSRAEIRAVIAHELSHIKNRDVAMMILANAYWFVTMPLKCALSRYRELLADEEGSMMTKSPKDLVSALTKMEHVYDAEGSLSIKGLDPVSAVLISPLYRSFHTLFSTHPLTKERIARLSSLDLRLNS